MGRAPRVNNPLSGPVDVDIGTRVRAQREALEMSQERLAELLTELLPEQLNITFQSVQEMEHGQIKFRTNHILAFMKALDVSMAYLYGFTSKAAPAPSGLRGELRTTAESVTNLTHVEATLVLARRKATEPVRKIIDSAAALVNE